MSINLAGSRHQCTAGKRIDTMCKEENAFDVTVSCLIEDGNTASVIFPHRSNSEFLFSQLLWQASHVQLE